MSHDAIEDQSLEPMTPTISSVSSELSFEDVRSISPMSSKDSNSGPKEHPTLFIRDDMVTILVEDTLFRVPSHFLTRSSEHLMNILKEKDTEDIVRLTDPDVSSSAFAHFLLVLQVLPSAGVASISTLAEWTDVLRLSSKWGFEYVRSVAIEAILPLASAVDKLVLGRTYGFAAWIPGAYADLLERSEDLSVAEIRRMDAEDIAAVARGRREARTGRVRPRADIEEMVKCLFPTSEEHAVADEGPPENVQGSTSGPSPGPAFDSVIERSGLDEPTQVRCKISRWIDQMSSCDILSRTVPVACLVDFMEQDATRVHTVLDLVLARGLQKFNWTNDSKGSLHSKRANALSYTNTWDGTADDYRYHDLFKMNIRNESLGLVKTRQAKDACLRLVDSWRVIQCLDLHVSLDELVASQPWKSVVHATKYLAYLTDGPGSKKEGQSYSVVEPSVFSAFWTTLAAVHQNTTSGHLIPLARATKALLAAVGEHTSRVAVSTEMDAFYQILEDTRGLAQEGGLGFEPRHQLPPLLDEIIKARRWPCS